MGRSGRLFSLLRPYTFLFVANSVATLVASVMDGATFVLLIPFLRTLFGQQAIPVGGGSSVERVLAAVAGPLLAAGSPEGALRNVVAGPLGPPGTGEDTPVNPTHTKNLCRLFPLKKKKTRVTRTDLAPRRSPRC